MQASSGMSTNEFSVSPRVDLTSKINDDELKFTLSGVNVSIANGLRRILLSEIPMVVFRTMPSEKNKCTIAANTCGLNNEIVKHRLSCIPIHIKDVEDFPLKNYVMNLNVENNTDTTMGNPNPPFLIIDPKGAPIKNITIQAMAKINFRCHSIKWRTYNLLSSLYSLILYSMIFLTLLVEFRALPYKLPEPANGK